MGGPADRAGARLPGRRPPGQKVTGCATWRRVFSMGPESWRQGRGGSFAVDVPGEFPIRWAVAQCGPINDNTRLEPGGVG